MGRAVAILAALAAAAHADFEAVDEVVLDTYTALAFDITSDGTNWYAARLSSPSWDVLDQDFAYVSTTYGIGGARYRAVSYSEGRGTIFAADIYTGDLHELTLDGELVGIISGLPRNQIVSLSVHRLDDTIWAAAFAGALYHYDADGNLLASFDLPFTITAVAIDEQAETLLVMRNDDLVYEYDYEGNLVGIPLDWDAIPDNGLGLYYDTRTATLHATTYSGPARMTAFQDRDRPTLRDTPSADCDGDGAVRPIDFACFMRAWSSREDEADCNADGVHDVLDLVCFREIYAQGGAAARNDNAKRDDKPGKRPANTPRRAYGHR